MQRNKFIFRHCKKKNLFFFKEKNIELQDAISRLQKKVINYEKQIAPLQQSLEEQENDQSMNAIAIQALENHLQEFNTKHFEQIKQLSEKNELLRKQLAEAEADLKEESKAYNQMRDSLQDHEEITSALRSQLAVALNTVRI